MRSLARNRNRGHVTHLSNSKGRSSSHTSPIVRHPHHSSEHLPHTSKRHDTNASSLERNNTCYLIYILARIPRSHEKPQKLQSYEGMRDPDEHVEHINNTLDYYHAQRVVKCKLFALALTRVAMTWFRTIPNKSIYS